MSVDVERPNLIDAAREVVRFYGTDRTWSLTYRTLLGSRIDDLAEALAQAEAERERPTPKEIADWGNGGGPRFPYDPITNPDGHRAEAERERLRDEIAAAVWGAAHSQSEFVCRCDHDATCNIQPSEPA